MNRILNLINIEAKNLSFKKKNSAWYKSFEQLTHVISFQKSRWSKSGSLHAAIGINKLSGDFPKPHQCDLKLDASDFLDDPDPLILALNYEEYWKMDDQDRQEEIKLALCSVQMNVFRFIENLKDLKQYVSKRSDIYCRLSLDAKNMMHLPLDYIELKRNSTSQP